MSDAYAGMSDEQIINEQAGSLASKDNYQTKDSYNPRNTVTSEESNVNESGVEEFAGAQVSVGRTGQTGGGTSAQNIPPEEGGLDTTTVQGESSDRFEGPGGVEESRREVRFLSFSLCSLHCIYSSNASLIFIFLSFFFTNFTETRKQSRGIR